MKRILALLSVFLLVSVGTVAGTAPTPQPAHQYGLGQMSARVTTTIAGFGTYTEVGDIAWQRTDPSEVPYYMTTRVQFIKSRAWHRNTEGDVTELPVPVWHLLDLHSNALAPVIVETWMR